MNRIARRLRSILKPAREATVVPVWEASAGEVPEVPFTIMVSIYRSDPMARAAVDFLADQAVGSGFYTTVDDGYEAAAEAKRAVDSFNERVNLDGLLQVAAREIIGFGNSFWEKITPGDLRSLRILPIVSIERIRRTKQGTPTAYVQSASYGGGALRPDQVIHFRWNPVSSEAEGCGLLRTLAESLGTGDGAREPFYRMKARMQQAMMEQFEKFSAPNELWIFPKLSRDDTHAYARQVKKVPRKGARFITNVEGAQVRQVVAERHRGFDGYVENIINDYILGLQTPLPKLFTTPGFTEASARAALEVAERKVRSLQRFIKRVVEREIFAPLINQAGLDAEAVGCRLSWGQPTVREIEMSDVLKAFELGAVRREELRKNLAKSGWELWDEKSS